MPVGTLGRRVAPFKDVAAFQGAKDHMIGAMRREIGPDRPDYLCIDYLALVDVHFAVLAPPDLKVKDSDPPAQVAVQGFH